MHFVADKRFAHRVGGMKQSGLRFRVVRTEQFHQFVAV